MNGDDLRTVMRRFPSGVAVVSAAVEARPVAVTVGSLVSLSLEPPLIGVAIGLHTPMHEHLREAGAFGVSVLGRGQTSLAQHFARGGVPPVAAWQGVESHHGESGVPLLADAAAWLECRLAAEHAVGDHTFFVGEVISAEPGPREPGLAYLQRDYVDIR